MSKQETDLPGRRQEMMSGRGRFAGPLSRSRSFAIPVSSVPRIVTASYPAPFQSAHFPVRPWILVPHRHHPFRSMSSSFSLVPLVVSSGGKRGGAMSSARVVRSLRASKQAGGRSHVVRRPRLMAGVAGIAIWWDVVICSVASKQADGAVSSMSSVRAQFSSPGVSSHHIERRGVVIHAVV